MSIHADKKQENKIQSVANTVSQKSSGEFPLQFVDNGPEAIAQRKLQEMANNSPLSKQIAQLQPMVDNHSVQQQKPIQKKENNTGLPDNIKSGIENLSGYSMDDVKVHRNSDQPAQLHAHAYAQGTDIHLGPGQEKHLPHEAWHVVQQKQGRVKPTLQLKDKVYVNDDAVLEKEADVMGLQTLTSGNSNYRNNKVELSKNVSAQYTEKIYQRVLAPLPDITYKKNIPQILRDNITNTQKDFVKANENLRIQYDVLIKMGYQLPSTDQLFRVGEVAKNLDTYFANKWSSAKREKFTQAYNYVRQEEGNDVIRNAEREIEDRYPIKHEPQGKTLNKILKGIFNVAEKEDVYIPLEFIEKIISTRSLQDIKDAGANPRLVELAASRIAGTGTVPKLMILLHAKVEGEVHHYQAEHADAIIQEHLPKWIPNIIMGGQTIAGNVAVIKGSAWEKTIKAYLVGKVPSAMIKDTLQSGNAFNSPDGKVFICADRGNPGTMIHEGIHFYAPDNFLRTFGESLNEGVTEYFARKITTKLGISRNNYDSEYKKALEVVRQAGEEILLNAYFKGEVDAIKPYISV